MIDLAGVVLCGGESRRMGQSKAWLDFDGEPLLLRALGRLAHAVGPRVVVAAPQQKLPELPDDVELLRDPVQGQGPLQGIAVGLAALASRARFAFVTSTDAPFLAPAYVRRMRALVEGHDIVVLRDSGHHHPLSAVYATRVGAEARALLDADQRRPFFLFERCRTRFVERDELLEDDELRAADPELWTLRNLNTPDDYAQALADMAREPARPR
jgi:molybdenum cofactor guanylyltransferase